MPDVNSPDVKEGSPQPVVVLKKAQEVINAVQKDKAVGVYEDTYMDELHPDYLVFFDQSRFADFESTLTQLKAKHDVLLFEKLKELASKDVLPDHLHWRYRDGGWKFSPEELLQNESDQEMQDEDDEWFDAQREHFRKIRGGEGKPMPKMPQKVLDLAIEIAERDGGRAPEEADFNTAILRLRDELPKEIVDEVLGHLKAVEEGRSRSRS